MMADRTRNVKSSQMVTGRKQPWKLYKNAVGEANKNFESKENLKKQLVYSHVHEIKNLGDQSYDAQSRFNRIQILGKANRIQRRDLFQAKSQSRTTLRKL